MNAFDFHLQARSNAKHTLNARAALQAVVPLLLLGYERPADRICKV